MLWGNPTQITAGEAHSVVTCCELYGCCCWWQSNRGVRCKWCHVLIMWSSLLTQSLTCYYPLFQKVFFRHQTPLAWEVPYLQDFPASERGYVCVKRVWYLFSCEHGVIEIGPKFLDRKAMFCALFNQLWVQHSVSTIFDPRWLDTCSKLPANFTLFSGMSLWGCPLTIKVSLPLLYPWRCSCEIKKKIPGSPHLYNFNVCVPEQKSLGMRLLRRFPWVWGYIFDRTEVA